VKTTRLLLFALVAISSSGLGAADAPLSLATARELALKAHPRITIAQLRALLAREGVTEARAGFLPVIAANATYVESGQQITRITSGSLSNSQIFDHAGVGATLNWVVTDFGRTPSLGEAARQRLLAADAEVLATRAQLLLEVDAAFFDALKAGSVRVVANRTLSARQAQFERTSNLARNELRSELDVRFARVSLDEARLLVEAAEKDWRAALTTLGSLLGLQAPNPATNLETPPGPGELPADCDALTTLALRQRPELQRQRAEAEALRAAARAARAARLPTVSVAAAAGVTPTNDPRFQRNYAAGGLNLNVPLFAGGIYRSRQHQAELQAAAAEAAVLERGNLIARDVRLAWLEAGYARERIALTRSLLENAEAALSLARTRFEQGLSSTVELTQAELAKTTAEIANTTAEFGYRVRLRILDYQTGSLR